MKNHWLLLGLLTLVNISFAQNYETVQRIGTTAPYTSYVDATFPDYQLLFYADNPPADGYSTWQSLPFDFEFYGEKVNGYYGSINGYITFDSTAISNDSKNTMLPDTSAPNNMIGAFWDELTYRNFEGDLFGGMHSWTYGKAPDRVHVIQWEFLEDVAASGSLTFAIRLYECGDFDIIHNGSGASEASGTVGCQNATGTIGQAIGGSPNLIFPDVSSNGNEIVYHYYWAEYDLSLAKIDLPKNVNIGENDLKGTITNVGKNTVTSFDLNYTLDGGEVFSQSISGVNIPPSGNYQFIHDVPFNLQTQNVLYELCVYTDNINSGQTDLRSCNDEKCHQVFTISGVPGKKTVLLEEFSGAWCGYCPDGDLIAEALIKNNEPEVIGISIHAGDKMEVASGRDIDEAFSIFSYPSGLVNRRLYPGNTQEPISRFDWGAATTSQLGTYTPVNVSLSHTYDPATRTLDMTIVGDFVDGIFADIRFVAMITEDSITGMGNGYDQSNNFDGTPGHPYENAGNPIEGYVHNRVLRRALSGTFGNKGVIPEPVLSSTQVSENFTYVLPGSWKPENINLVGFIAHYSLEKGQREILDAATVSLVEETTAVLDLPRQVRGISLFPNPASEILQVSFDLLEKTTARIAIFDIYGRQVLTAGNGFEKMNFDSGAQQLTYDISSLPNGHYQMSIITSEHTIFTKTFQVAQ